MKFGVDGDAGGADVPEQLIVTVVLLLTPPAVAVMVAVPGWLAAVNSPNTLPPLVVPWVGVIVPLVALKVTGVPSATPAPVAERTTSATEVLPPQLRLLEEALRVIWLAGPATGVESRAEPPYCAHSCAL